MISISMAAQKMKFNPICFFFWWISLSLSKSRTQHASTSPIASRIETEKKHENFFSPIFNANFVSLISVWKRKETSSQANFQLSCRITIGKARFGIKLKNLRFQFSVGADEKDNNWRWHQEWLFSRFFCFNSFLSIRQQMKTSEPNNQ